MLLIIPILMHIVLSFTIESAHMSGIITTVACGISAQAFGSTLINDLEMMNSFWILVEQLLNILLFTLAGAVWGGVIGDAAGSTWGGTDWGYMVLVYVLVNVIRFFLVGAFYPIFSRLGLKSCWQEATFLSYA
jgi:NhaP-type Na+/H+ or K+/H+ antiporter